jgi:protein-S-isoprenylcysteine O-methyltransferase Ste14
MNFLPQFSISLHNAFWFTLLFWISNLIILKIFPAHYKNRVLKRAPFNGHFQKIISTFNFILYQSLLIMVLFMPLQFDTSYFVVGLSIFIIAFIGYLFSIVNYATSNPEKPVTKGIYKLSRNPQQIMTIVMWIGLGLMTNCMLVISICVIQLFTVYPTFKAQECFCIEKYGKEYQDYMERTPRYFLYF